jgi:hypothetical protein
MIMKPRRLEGRKDWPHHGHETSSIQIPGCDKTPCACTTEGSCSSMGLGKQQAWCSLKSGWLGEHGSRDQGDHDDLMTSSLGTSSDPGTRFPCKRSCLGSMPTRTGRTLADQSRRGILASMDLGCLGHMPAWLGHSLGLSTTNKRWNVDKRGVKEPILSWQQGTFTTMVGRCLGIQ